jgi:hypothetical protein
MKNIKKLIIIVTLIVAISSINVSAQNVHEFSVYGGGGLSTLNYKLSHGDRSAGFGGDFGVGYTFFRVNERGVETGKVFREYWGIHTGIGLGLYNAKSKLNNQEAITKGLDDGDVVFNKFDLHTTLSGYNETQNAIFLNIPVMAQFQIDQFYVMGGFKFGIPVSGKFKSKNATLTNKAYYIEAENWANTQEFMGYGKFPGMNIDGNIDFGLSTMFALESGMKWRIGDNLSLYTGAYFDYGLNNVLKDGNLQFVNYDSKSPDKFTTNSVLSSYIDSSKSSTFTDKVNTMAVGIKIRIALEK